MLMREGNKMLTLGIFGFGTVGSAVVELLREYEEEIQLKWICVRDVGKRRETRLPKGCSITGSSADILDDPQVNMVVELMGTVDLAFSYVSSALRKGKHVVTANKAMLARHLPALEQLLEKAVDVHFQYEASVCGGIPIIASMRRSLSCEKVTKMTGILNGTTNYILSQMQKTGGAYLDTLKEAQAKGFAEADPSADVDGLDARAKLCILTRLGLGAYVGEEKISCKGISRINADDFAYAKMIGHVIKLLGIAEVVEVKEKENEMQQSSTTRKKISLSVAPVLVPIDHHLASVDGCYNSVLLESRNLGTTCFTGPGAGGLATANSVVADILDVLSRVKEAGANNRGETPSTFGGKEVQADVETDLEASFYIRLNVCDKLGIISTVAEVCAKLGVSIFSILQVPIVDPCNVPFVIVTDRCRQSQVDSVCNELEEKSKSAEFSWLRAPPLCLRYL